VDALASDAPLESSVGDATAQLEATPDDAALLDGSSDVSARESSAASGDASAASGDASAASSDGAPATNDASLDVTDGSSAQVRGDESREGG